MLFHSAFVFLYTRNSNLFLGPDQKKGSREEEGGWGGGGGGGGGGGRGGARRRKIDANELHFLFFSMFEKKLGHCASTSSNFFPASSRYLLHCATAHCTPYTYCPLHFTKSTLRYTSLRTWLYTPQHVDLHLPIWTLDHLIFDHLSCLYREYQNSPPHWLSGRNVAGSIPHASVSWSMGPPLRWVIGWAFLS